MKTFGHILKSTLTIICITLATSIYSQWTAGQEITINIEPVALIESNNAYVKLKLKLEVAGDTILEIDKNTDVRLKMSSLVPDGTSRQITVSKISGYDPPGASAKCRAVVRYTANSGGELGYNHETVLIEDFDQPIVSGIQDGWTGTDSRDGYKIVFKLRTGASRFYLLRAGNYHMTVVFTLTEAY